MGLNRFYMAITSHSASKAYNTQPQDTQFVRNFDDAAIKLPTPVFFNLSVSLVFLVGLRMTIVLTDVKHNINNLIC